MKSIQAAQSQTVNDTCNDCGSFVDIGTVIDTEDRRLTLHFAGEDALTCANDLSARAVERFDDVNTVTQSDETGLVLHLDFAYSAEKMIFQLENQL